MLDIYNELGKSCSGMKINAWILVFYWYHTRRRCNHVDLVLGIDGGGTSCRAAVATPPAGILGRAKSGAANIRTDLTGARANIVEASRLAFAEAGIDPDRIDATPALLGLAGSNVGTYRQQLEAILPFPRCIVESDALIALEGALGAADGAIAILGTGSAYMMRRGEHGANGRRLGFSCRRPGRAAAASAGTCWKKPCSPTTTSVRPLRSPPRCSPCSATIRATSSSSPRPPSPAISGVSRRWCSTMPRSGDTVAETILARAVAAIEASLGVLALRANEPLCLLGGLAALYGPRLSAPYRDRLRQPLQDALGGAVSMAARRFAAQEDRRWLTSPTRYSAQ